MMQQPITAEGSCCFEGRSAVNPLDLENIVVAGGVGMEASAENAEGSGCRLAMIYFPSQVYRAGFEPSEALHCGTLFPELVSPYMGGGC